MNRDEILDNGLEKIRRFIKDGNYKTVRVYQGDYIIKQNDELTNVYWASVVQYTIQHTSCNGKTLSLGNYYSEDRFLGEVEFLSARPLQFDVIATADTDLVVIPQKQLQDALIQDGIMAFWLSYNVSQIYQDSMQVAIERSLYPLKYNILKDIFSQKITDEQSKSHTYMYQEAQRFGCTERAYNRVVRELIDEGLIIKTSNSHLIIATDCKKVLRYLEDYYE